MSLDDLLNDTATVQAQTASRDTSGGVARTWSDLYTSVPVRIEDASASTVMTFQYRGMAITNTVYTRQSGIGVQHRLATSDGRYLLVRGVQHPRAIGGQDGHYILQCEEWRPGS